jgi:NAD(P)-dependent dehydrogenase (short-subunit alcohol dehydrogenase family)
LQQNTFDKQINKYNLNSLTMEKLVGKTAIIIGGSSGIGFATAKQFLDEGAKVVITGRSKEALVKAANQLGNGVTYIENNAGKIDDNKKLPSLLSTHGITEVDIVFYNAGALHIAPFEQMSVEGFEENINITLRGAYFTIQTLLPTLKKGASIIFNATVLGHRTMFGQSANGAAKAALTYLSKNLSVELASKGIRVNTVSPGSIDTPIYNKLGLTEEQKNSFASSFIPKIPLARFGKPDEIAKVVTFLASDDSSYITGTELIVDGGMKNLL